MSSFGRSFPTVCISATGTSKSVAIPVGTSSCRVCNTSGTLTVFTTFGVGSATAVIPTADNATGTDVHCTLPYEFSHIDVPKGANTIACIGSGAGPTLVYFELGSSS